MARKNFTAYTFGWLVISAVLLVKSPIQPLRNIFDYKGRATVREFWLFFIFWVNLIPFVLGYYIAGVFGVDLYLDVLVILPYVSLCVRRLHDVGWSGKWVILIEGLWYALMTISVLEAIGLLQLLCLLLHIVMAIVIYGRKGLKGYNQYGEQPYDYV